MRMSVLVALVSLAGCATMGYTSDQAALKKQVAFDHDCPQEKIQVLQSMEGGLGRASFKLDACGKQLRYERMGTSYFDADKGDPVSQATGKSTAPASTSTAGPAATR